MAFFWRRNKEDKFSSSVLGLDKSIEELKAQEEAVEKEIGVRFAKAIEKKVAKADAANQAKLDKASERIRTARESARAEIVAAAAEMTQDVAAKVAGLKVSTDEALKAVESAHG